MEDPIDREFALEFQKSTLFNVIPPSFLEKVVSETMRVPVPVFKAALQGDIAADNKSRLSDIKAPGLILWGDKDLLVPVEDQQIQKNSNPNANLVIYPETGHALHWERPGKFVHDLENFLLTLEPDE